MANLYIEKESVIRQQYEALDLLAEGGTAITLKCKDKNQNRIVVVKRYRPERLTPPFEKRIRHEPLLNLGRNEYLVQSEEAFKIDGIFNSIQPFVEGDSLIDILETSQIEEPSAVYAVLCITKAVESFHAINLVLTDVKPDNVIVTPQGKPILIDLVCYENAYTKAEVSQGTATYAPPELQNRDTLYPATDVYSLAVMLFEMLVGETEFLNIAPNWQKDVQRYIQPDVSRVSQISPQAWKIIDRAVRADPTKRHKNATELSKELLAYYQSITGHVTHPQRVLSLICQNGRELRIQKGRTIIGRAHIDPLNRYISDRQFEVSFDGMKSAIIDLNSINRTRVNKKDIPPGVWVAITEMDTIEVPNVVMRAKVR